MAPNTQIFRTSERIGNKIMERKIGEIFEFEGVKLQVVKDYDGDCGMDSIGCYFLDDLEMCSCRQKCFVSQRKDRTPVKFIRIGNKMI